MQNGLPVRLLGLLTEGGIRSLGELARGLDVSEALVRLMVEELTRRGYLAPLGGDCATACAGCALSNACSVSGSHATKAPVLGLTAKGRQAAANAETAAPA